MKVFDDEGSLFGLINIIDLLVVLLIVAIVVAGVSLVTSSQANESQTITFRTTPQPEYVVEAISLGLVPTDEVVIINRKSVIQQDDGRHVAVLIVTLRVELRDNVPLFDGERLYIGRSLRLDLGSTIVDGIVIDMEPLENRT